MRVTTLTSLAVLALFCPLAPCAAQDSPPNAAAVEKAKAAKPSESSGAKAKIGKARMGSLSPDEAKRAARARERAAAALRPRAPATAEPAEVAAKPVAKPEKQAATPAPAKTPIKAAETRPAPKPEVRPEAPAVRTVETRPTNVAPETRPAAAASATAAQTGPAKPVTAAVDHPDADVGRSVSTRSSKHATRSAEARRKRLAARAERRRAPDADEAPPVRYGSAGDPGPDYPRAGIGERRGYVVVEGPRPVYEGRSLFGPRPMWRPMPPPQAFAYPPYPRPYGYGYDD